METSIEINAPAAKLWGMFTDPAFTGQMGGEYVSDWSVGSTLKWKGSNGQILTSGIIQEIEPQKILRHTLFSAPDSSEVMATLTYKFSEKDGKTTVHVREEFTRSITDEERADAIAGWNAALASAKEIAEK